MGVETTSTTSPPTKIQRRSSSQTSTSSRRSQKSKPVRSKPLKRLSACSSTHTPTDLTSFPSLSPDRSPEGFFGEPALNHALSRALLAEDNVKGLEPDRGRKSTLDGLTTNLPQLTGRAALFNDNVSFHDVPGSLHLANDDHIERLIARSGAVKLVRQFARDLALRDAEISALRLRSDERERELKKMLREVEVSNQDIERRLYGLEHTGDSSMESSKTDAAGESFDQRSLTASLDNMMSQAMLEDISDHSVEGSKSAAQREDIEATIRPHRKDSDPRSGNSSAGSSKKNITPSVRGWQDYIWGSSPASRKTSRASSVKSDENPRSGETGLRIPNAAPNRRKALDGQLFQPPDSGPDNAAVRRMNSKSGDGDDRSIVSQRSTGSVTSWTVRLFAGSGKDTVGNRARSRTPDPRQRNSSPAVQPTKPPLSALAALKRINSSTGVQSLSGKSSTSSSVRGGPTSLNPAGSRRLPGSAVPPLPSPANTASQATNLGPVEMDAILPMELRPPTLAHIYGDYNPNDVLTDRFGFIYDQRRNKRQREANSERRAQENSPGVGGTATSTVDVHHNGTTIQPGDGMNSDMVTFGQWQDYLKVATTPTELLSHTPAAGPVISIQQATETRPRISSIAIDKSGSVSVANNTPQPSAFTSPVVSNHAEFVGTTTGARPREASASESNEPVKLLLQRLTDLHDESQRERTVKWNEFMRKVRAERRKEGEAAASSTVQDRSSVSRDMPEVALADGEVVGIAGLGNKGKIGRAKWREFKGLVLAGIPVAYRAKIWSECSGANALRVPGYYDDLVKGHTAIEADPGAIAQIGMDIHRTLTDNIFFRKGPGVAKLNEVLLAYSRRNPEVGYCQGMNLITGSLLLIMPTAEDAFWILASIIENILPAHYYDHGLVASRADQQVLRQYVAEILPNLASHFDDLNIELEALTFQWFLSIFTDCLSAEALYRVWDVVLCLNTSSTTASALGTDPSVETTASDPNLASKAPLEPPASAKSATFFSAVDQDVSSGTSTGEGSTFFFQVALALLKLNEQQLLSTCSTAAAVYSYLNHQMTNHAISIDGLIQASEALRNVVKREDVLARRAIAIEEMTSPRPKLPENGNSQTDIAPE
ncbi:hypothetical protein FQN57_004170 [Myotisia sp. PD_48]|nr:hypothetical protein FQN57_004170 [Myotisia sp. PD_48]